VPSFSGGKKGHPVEFKWSIYIIFLKKRLSSSAALGFLSFAESVDYFNTRFHKLYITI
jgi:hypothetical protein